MEKHYKVFFEKLAQDYYQDPYTPQTNYLGGTMGLVGGALLGRFGGKALGVKAGEYLAKSPNATKKVGEIFGKVPKTETLQRVGKWGGMAAGGLTGYGFMS